MYINHNRYYQKSQIKGLCITFMLVYLCYFIISYIFAVSLIKNILDIVLNLELSTTGA